MKRTLLVMALLVFLPACATPISRVSSSATPHATATSAADAPTNSSATPAAGTTTDAATGSDFFTQNGISLAAPTCDGTLTPEQTEGPYYKQGSPEQNILYQSGMTGTRLIVVGYVLDANCDPIPGAWLDFWQADGNGNYDNQGYTLRGYQFTDDQGRYYLETVVPGEYPGRTQHIHVKVQAPGGQVLTSQLYFPGSPGNNTDNIYTPSTQVTIEDHGDYEVAYYNFVVNSE